MGRNGLIAFTMGDAWSPPDIGVVRGGKTERLTHLNADLFADKTLGKVADFKVVTKRAPTAEECAGLLFGWTVVKHVKSNAIVYCRGEQTLGVGAGQMARVDSSRIAVWKAKEAGLDLQGSVVASEALFPFADGLIAAAEAGATAAIQPGGSVRDDEVIKAADARGLAMVFTGQRHFKH